LSVDWAGDMGSAVYGPVAQVVRAHP
jgi:hypothetical protein